MQIFLYAQGTRVRVRRGPFPMDADLLDREGLVVETDPYRPGRYGVILDGEDAVREFHEEELEALGEAKPESRLGEVGPEVG